MSKAKAVEVGGVGGDADLGEAGGEGDPVEGWGGELRCRGSVGGFEVGGVEGVGEEGVLDVGGDEFQVLLLVLEAEDDAAGGFVFDGMLEEAVDGGVDVGAIGEDGVEGRAGEGGAELFLGHVAEGVVVAVEEPAEVGMEGLVAGDELAEDEGLEEPAGVGEVPFDGAGLGTGLDHQVFGGERATECGGGGADGLVAGEERWQRSRRGRQWLAWLRL